MLGKLQQKKIERLFRIFDRDANGLLRQDDFSDLARIRGVNANVDVNSPQYQEMLTALMAWWENICQAADTNNNGQVTLDEWMTFWGKWLTAVADEAGSGQKPALEAMKKSVSSTFDTMDTDKNGQITLPEYASWLKSYGIEGDAGDIFRCLDLNGDGVLTRDETIKLAMEFFLTNDPEAVGNHLYGPLF